MTPRIWVERPIPRVEALSMDEFPPSTIAIHPDHDPVERCSCSRWENGDGDRYDSEMAGWVALVRVEATEEWSTGAALSRWDADAVYPSEDHVRRDGWDDALIRRLATPWEDA